MNLSNRSSKILAVVLLSAALPVSAMAQEQGSRPEGQQGPDMAAMAQSLNVSVSTIQSCLPRPEQGARPERPDVAQVTACLKADNAGLTQDAVGAALEANAPPPPRG